MAQEVNTKGAATSDDLYDDDGDDIQENQFLSFHIENEIYAIDLLNVMEIIRIIAITKIPESLPFIKGVINLRGKIIPVMDVRLRFGLDEKPYADRTCIIVVSIKGVEMGLIVDSVAEVLEIQAKDTEIMPSSGKSTAQRYVRGIGKTAGGVKIILELERLLFDEEVEQIKQLNA